MEKLKERTGIYHEHQQGSLCGQHTLNNLLQGPMFSVDTLAEIARQLDIEEINVLDHTSFKSENMDDTGFFSIQVLQLALKPFDIELVPYGSQEDIAKQARRSPESIQAYICNLGLHWFTIRRFGGQYFDLNSFYNVPKLLSSDMMLPAFLEFIQGNGYSVFIVNGPLQSCLADQRLESNPIGPAEYRTLTKDLQKMVMDGKVIGSAADLEGHERLTLYMPQPIFDEYRKNPQDSYIRNQIRSQLPEEFRNDDPPDDKACTGDDHIHFSRRIIIVPALLTNTKGKQTRPCLCQHCQQRSTVKTERSSPKVMNKPLADTSVELKQETQVIERVTQYLVNTVDPNKPNEPPKQTLITSREILVTGPPQSRDKALLDAQRSQQLNKPNIDFDNDDDELLRHAMAASLLDTTDMDDDMNSSIYEENAERVNQHLLKLGLAASLLDSTQKRLEETQQLLGLTNTDSFPPTSINSEPVLPPNSSLSTQSYFPSPLTNTHSSSPPKNSNPFLPTDTNSSLPTNTHSSLPKTTNSFSSTDTHSSSKDVNSPSPTTTFSNPLIVTETEPVKSPSIEELRQRRLQFYGNRDRSIISQCNSSD